MQFLFWLLIMVLVSIVVYQFLPSVQIYLDDKWTDLTSGAEKLNKFVDDDRFHVPEELQPTDTVREHYAKRDFSARRWGGPDRDGPDRSMPDECRWIRGMLHCASRSRKKS